MVDVPLQGRHSVLDTMDSEETPLIDTSSQNLKHPWYSLSRYSPVSLIIPIAVACRLSMLLPSTTTFDLIHQLICRLWYAKHGKPGDIPPSGHMPDALCSIPPIDKNYATALTLMGLVDGVGLMVGYSVVSFLASRFGRKPAILLVLGISIAGDVFLISSSAFNPLVELVLAILWVLCLSLTNPLILAYVVNLYIIDLVDAEERTSSLSYLSGWAFLGGALSFSFGGLITTTSSNPLPVYYIAAGIMATGWIYIVSILPESFPVEKRLELRRQRQIANAALTVDPQHHRAKRFFHTLAIPLEPLKQLKPTRHVNTGKRNWRLVFCAIHIFLANMGDSYAVVSMILFLTTRYNYTPAETGYVLTTLNLTQVFVLTVIVPFVVRSLRPLYKRRAHLSSNEALEDEDTVTEASDHLDVHITFISWTIEAFAYIVLGTTNKRITQLATVVLLGFGAGRTPVFRSLVATSVDPLKQGEALAAIEIIGSFGSFLSPIVMGSILTSTISTRPQLVFYVHGIVVLVAASVLLLIRDSDRYQKPHED